MNSEEKLSTVEEEEQEPSANHMGLLANLSPEDEARVKEEAERILASKMAYNKTLNLSKDVFTVPDQNYCVLSWFGPTLTAKNSIYGFRVMGAFSDKPSAIAYINRLKDKRFDTGFVSMNEWVFSYPDTEDYVFVNGSVDYERTIEKTDNHLNRLICEHRKKLAYAEARFNIRKEAVKTSKLTREAVTEDSAAGSESESFESIDLSKEKEPESGTEPGTESELTGNSENPEAVAALKETVKVVSRSQATKKVPEQKARAGSRHKAKSAKAARATNNKNLGPSPEDKIPRQSIAVLSFINPTGKNAKIPMSIKGIFKDDSDADDFIANFQESEETFDLVKLDMYEWVPCDPDLSGVSKKYSNQYLDKLIETENSQRAKVAAHYSRVKREFGDTGPIVTESAVSAETGEEEEEEYVSASSVLDSMLTDVKRH